MNIKPYLRACNNNGLKPNHLAILLTLAEDPTVRHTYNDLNQHLGIPVPTLVRALASLYELSLIHFHQGSVGGTPNPHAFQHKRL